MDKNILIVKFILLILGMVFIIFIMARENGDIVFLKNLMFDVDSFEKQADNIEKKQLTEEENKIVSECRFILTYSLDLLFSYFENQSLFNIFSKPDDIKINLTLLNDYLEKMILIQK